MSRKDVRSSALTMWQGGRSAELDQIEAAHHAIGGRGPGRRYATRQVNHAYAVLLSSQFQGFCRDLHTEAVDHLLRGVDPERWHLALHRALVSHRALDRGNPHSGAIGNDFGRLGMALWDLVYRVDRRNRSRRQRLDELNRWRNAVAHQDFDSDRLGGRTSVTLDMIRTWCSACDALAASLDRVVVAYAQAITKEATW